MFEGIFFFHKKHPNLVVTDQDLALSAVLNKQYPTIIHLLCQWHIQQNFKKHFSYLQTMNLKSVYERIMELPYLSEQSKFKEEVDSIIETLKSKKFNKSSSYLEHVCKFKGKWANSFVPKIFTAGIQTTSRIEPINASIKRYVNSKSEISQIFYFMIDFEEKLEAKLINEANLGKKQENILVKLNPLLRIMRATLSDYIFQLHLDQFQLSSQYKIEPIELNLEDLKNHSFILKNKNKNEGANSHIITLIDSKYFCPCDTWIKNGVVCRHMFYVAQMRQDEDLKSINILPRWLIKDKIATVSLATLFKDQIEKNQKNGEVEERKEEEKKEEKKDEQGLKNQNQSIFYMFYYIYFLSSFF